MINQTEKGEKMLMRLFILLFFLFLK